MSAELSIDMAALAYWMNRLSEPFVSPTSRVGIWVVLIGWGIGILAWLHYFPRTGTPLRDYLRHAFPRSVYLSRSCALDVQLALLNLWVGPARWLVRGLSATVAASFFARLLDQTWGKVPEGAESAAPMVFLGIMLFLVFDFGTYVAHRLSHRVPVLWAFHRLHHSAESLNPLTLMRKHPVYDAFSVMIDCLTVAPLQALIIHFWGQGTNTSVLAASNMGFAMFAYGASSLRHTHIWLSWGPWLDRLAVSPALHQIHHSKAERHLDTNYGEVLSIWDWMFGSLYLPHEREELDFGLADTAQQPHRNLIEALVEPFAYAWGTIVRSRLPGSQPA